MSSLALGPFTVRVSALLVSASALALPGCKKDEPPPPLPIEAPAATAEAPLQLKPEDAGVPPKVEEKPKATGGARSSAGSLQKCCAALQQNAVNAPEPTRTYMLQAAAVCSAAVAQGQDKSSITAALTNALKGAGMPVACK